LKARRNERRRQPAGSPEVASAMLPVPIAPSRALCPG
jgi:hypothetical protein